ncbi:hypothetical protein [Methylobacterium oryzihabitans]|uniref:Uncharacterized protein n=1 Tax=Methylobacterium oryzihabitans TaxID=2499852 RepID=A0A437PEL6_9HYPH|nr:hypothetical protein [Methylobacterium oryzihabitans]RVU20710.1 hypothetical protein EOE48_05030 [Methylobacterium oryzihabitans]
MLVVAVAASVGRAQACDCLWPRRLKTDEERLAYRFNQAKLVATLRVDRVRIPDARRGEPDVFGDATVIKTIKGKLDRKIRLRTSGGDESANCGLGTSLFQAASDRRLLTVALTKASRTRNTFGIGSCGYFELDAFHSAPDK